MMGGSEDLVGQVVSVITNRYDYRTECLAAARGENGQTVWIAWEGGPSTRPKVCIEICQALGRALLA